MRIITSWRRAALAAAAFATLGFAAHAQAQYAPYGVGQTQYPPAQSQSQYAATAQQYGAYMPQQPVQQPMQQQVPPQYAAQGAYQGYPYQQPTATSPYSVPHVAMNYQAAAAGAATPTPAVTPTEQLPLTPPAESVPAGAPQGGAMQGGAYVPTPSPENGYGYGAPGYQPQSGYESYPQAGHQGAGGQTGGCTTGGCASGGYGAQPYGGCDYSNCGGMSACIDKRCRCGYCFGGVYGLLMDRDSANKYPLVFTSNDPPTPQYGYYPQSNQVVLRTRNADIGFQPGVEFRLGYAFGCGCDCDPCNPCGGCAMSGPRWGIEGVYWGIFNETATAQYVDQGTLRTFSMMPMGGLVYNGRPVNDYFDYAPPTADHTVGGDIIVTLARVQSSFQVQNAEINLLKLGCCGGGSMGPQYSAAYGAGNCGGSCGSGCNSSSCGGCDGGLPMCGCGGCCPSGPRYSCVGVCGFRWMQFDEDFLYGVDFYNVNTPTTISSLNYVANTTNNLFGGQIGCNGVYRVGCKWGLHMGTVVGIYGNDVSVRQYMQSPIPNGVTFTTTGDSFDVNANKTDFSMVAEARLGVSCQATCHLGLYAGWRVIGVTGIALATDQAPNQFLDPAQLSNYVNSNGSLILNGLQAGVTWNY